MLSSPIIAMSISEAEYMGACCGAMTAAHIQMLRYHILHIGTPRWTASRQKVGTIPSILMINNAATVQIAQNGKLSRKARHVENRFDYIREGQRSGVHQHHWVPVDFQLFQILKKSQLAFKIDPQTLTHFLHPPTFTCPNV